eukprot:SAG31_NODE_589_length_13808_cov_3.896710_7_plen_172_part_00
MTEELFSAIWGLIGSGSELHETERTLFLSTLLRDGIPRRVTDVGIRHPSSSPRPSTAACVVLHRCRWPSSRFPRAAHDQDVRRVASCGSCGSAPARRRSISLRSGPSARLHQPETGCWRHTWRRRLHEPAQPEAIQPQRPQRPPEGIRRRCRVSDCLWCSEASSDEIHSKK